MRISKWFTGLFIVLATSCAQLGIPVPKTFNEQVAAAQTSVTAVVDDARILLLTKKITPDDATNVLKQTDNITEGLAVARVLNGTNPAAANDKLAATVLALNALQVYLAKYKGVK